MRHLLIFTLALASLGAQASTDLQTIYIAHGKKVSDAYVNGHEASLAEIKPNHILNERFLYAVDLASVDEDTRSLVREHNFVVCEAVGEEKLKFTKIAEVRYYIPQVLTNCRPTTAEEIVSAINLQ